MRLVKQVERMTCGQCCIAMLAGITVDEACDIVGHRKGTQLYEVTAALVRCGVRIKSRNRFEKFPMRHDVGTALVRLREPNGWRSHWAVWSHGVIFDPAPVSCHWPAVSYLEVIPTDEQEPTDETTQAESA